MTTTRPPAVPSQTEAEPTSLAAPENTIPRTVKAVVNPPEKARLDMKTFLLDPPDRSSEAVDPEMKDR